MKRITDAQLHAWVDSLLAQKTVYAPQAKGPRFAFDRLRRADRLRLDYDVTLLPPKKYFQPQEETLLTFSNEDGYTSVLPDEPFVLFGVHPCDMIAISQMDQVFTAENCDVHYLARRELATIVASDVQTASKNVFAGCLGYATLEGRTGFDALLTRLDDGTTIVEARTAKGEALLEGLADCPDAAEAEAADREAFWKAQPAKLQKHVLKMSPGEIPGLLDKGMDHPVWEEKAALCYSCGSCNLVCPTCYCFDVKEEMNWDMTSGRRVRVWDGCMLTAFAKVAGDHNFREDRSARYRHRYLRKGKYVPEATGGELSCVGCGRCITACTANIANPVEVFNRLLEAK